MEGRTICTRLEQIAREATSRVVPHGSSSCGTDNALYPGRGCRRQQNEPTQPLTASVTAMSVGLAGNAECLRIVRVRTSSHSMGRISNPIDPVHLTSVAVECLLVVLPNRSSSVALTSTELHLFTSDRQCHSTPFVVYTASTLSPLLTVLCCLLPARLFPFTANISQLIDVATLDLSSHVIQPTALPLWLDLPPSRLLV